METLRFKNYRCFEDTGAVEIRPITVLIGANSSGKSSFLKFFPLLKQSMGEMVNGTFLWAGPLVDLKDFANTVREGQEEIVIEYTLDSLPINRTVPTRARNALTSVLIQIHLAKRDEMFDYLCELDVKTSDFLLTVKYYPDSSSIVNLNGITSDSMPDVIHWGINSALIPKLYFETHEKKRSFDEYSENTRALLIKLFQEMGLEEDLWRRFLSSYYMDVFRKRDIIALLERFDKASIKDRYDYIADLVRFYHVNELIDSINYYFLYLARKMTYVKPLRAIAERYYRYQNYSVQEIDADGKNLPMFFSSLSKDAFNNLNKWINDIFGFTLELRSDGGHIEMLIKQKGDKVARNLTDLGFGYTQVLPILTILWKVIMMDCINGVDESHDVCKTHIVAIEQPELHLHPRYQGLFVEMMARVIHTCKREKKDIRIVIETHSEIIINRLGKLIAGKHNGIDEHDANIVVFNGLNEGLKSYVVQTTYDRDGFIKDWPYGFFSDYVD